MRRTPPPASASLVNPQLMLANNVNENVSTLNVTNISNAKDTSKLNSLLPKNKDNTIQSGLDRYITVGKRKRSPKSALNNNHISKNCRSENVNNNNRFAVLATDVPDPSIMQPELSETQSVAEKPPPIYIRTPASGSLVNQIKEIIGDNFYIVPMRKGKINETKVCTKSTSNFKNIVDWLDKVGTPYYTYQLKSQKGLSVIIKGIEANVNPAEIKEELEQKNFKVKSIINIFNKDKIPQPMFKVEIDLENQKIKGKHKIYDLKYLLYRRVIVEEPIKRSSLVQCHRCQEFGHTQ